MFMKKEIALNIEQMKHLRDLGLDCSGASMVYRLLPECFRHFEDYYLGVRVESQENKEAIPAFCLQDILELIPRQIREYKLECDCHDYISYVDYVASDDEEDGTNNYKVEGDILHCVCCKELITAAYEMLLWCIENGYVETNKTK